MGNGVGQSVVEHIMAEQPTPIVVLSSPVRDSPFGAQGAAAANALVGGALLATARPDRWTPDSAVHLRATIRRLRNAPVIRHPRARLRGRTRPAADQAGSAVVAIAASTGGPAALATLLGGLAGVRAPVLVVQHLHAEFVPGLAGSLARSSALPVEVARHGGALEPGHVYLAPGALHLRLDGSGRAELSPTPETLHRPSADVLFESIAEHAGSRGVGVLLTGMGEDGARGLTSMRERGAQTIAQDEATCAVFGMPRAAQRLGAVDRLVPLPQIAAAVMRAVQVVAV
jgi:two-component system chemotaxis response regulator CheB